MPPNTRMFSSESDEACAGAWPIRPLAAITERKAIPQSENATAKAIRQIVSLRMVMFLHRARSGAAAMRRNCFQLKRGTRAAGQYRGCGGDAYRPTTLDLFID